MSYQHHFVDSFGHFGYIRSEKRRCCVPLNGTPVPDKRNFISEIECREIFDKIVGLFKERSKRAARVFERIYADWKWQEIAAEDETTTLGSQKMDYYRSRRKVKADRRLLELAMYLIEGRD